MTDDTQTSQASSQTGPPLDDSADLMSYDTSFPLVDPGVYEMKITKAEVLDNAAKTVKLTLSNIETVRSTKGETMEPGRATVFDQVNTIVTGKSTPALINRGCAFIIQAVAVDGVNSVGALREYHKRLEGSTVLVKLETIPAGQNKSNGKSYDARTGVAKWFKKGAVPE